MDKTKGLPMNATRSVLTKKYKIDDGSHRYVEQATLLDPSNNNASTQNEVEELREVSTTLQEIKQKHDEARKLADKKQEELEHIRKEIDQTNTQEIAHVGPTTEMKDKLTNLNDCIKETHGRIQEEQFVQSSYSHMLGRMKQDFIAQKIITTQNDSALKNKQSVLELENQKFRTVKEQKLQSKATVDRLMENIEKEQTETTAILTEIAKCLKDKEESIQKRMERIKKNQEIAEQAANDSKDQSEIKDRQNLYIQKLWNAFMRKKMDKEMKNSQQIDAAFRDIKTATGVTDVQELVKRFLTREQNYSDLLQNVNTSDQKVDILKKQNEELRNRLHDLKIDTEANQAAASEGASGFQDEDILEMKGMISQQNKDFGQLQEKFKKVNIVNDQVSSWAKRVYSKFGTLADTSQYPSLKKHPEDLIRCFEAMEEVTVNELTQLKDRQEDQPIEPDDAFVEFATEDFINKNIRVRPISGVTHGGEGQHDRASTVSRGGQVTEGDDGTFDWHQQAEFELKHQREIVKRNYAQYQEEVRRKQALEEKKAQKK